ncbi:Protein of unknown function [Gryllus bimaculatus]|nr:Protein of unknown function [Gryllus bimaculatus]
MALRWAARLRGRLRRVGLPRAPRVRAGPLPVQRPVGVRARALAVRRPHALPRRLGRAQLHRPALPRRGLPMPEDGPVHPRPVALQRSERLR